MIYRCNSAVSKVKTVLLFWSRMLNQTLKLASTSTCRNFRDTKKRNFKNRFMVLQHLIICHY